MKSTAAIHVAKKQLGLDDDTYRALNMRVVGKPSSADMTEVERQRILDELRRLGFKPASKPVSKGSRKRLEGRFAPKLQALWIAGYNLGVITNGSDEALIAFVKRQTSVDHIRFLHHAEDARNAIEALKFWLTRTADVDWSTTDLTPDYARAHGFMIAAAQWRILNSSDGPAMYGFTFEVLRITGLASLHDMTSGHWIIVMNEFGRLLRMAKA